MQCGWLKDRYGLSWQIVPSRIREMLQNTDQAKTDRVFAAIMTMVKIDIAKLEAAYEGKPSTRTGREPDKQRHEG